MSSMFMGSDVFINWDALSKFNLNESRLSSLGAQYNQCSSMVSVRIPKKIEIVWWWFIFPFYVQFQSQNPPNYSNDEYNALNYLPMENAAPNYNAPMNNVESIAQLISNIQINDAVQPYPSLQFAPYQQSPIGTPAKYCQSDYNRLTSGKLLPSDYLCHLCFEKGHFIRNCPLVRCLIYWQCS